MAWLRRHLVIIVGLLVMLYILAPNFVVIAFSFNNPAGRFNYQWNQFSFDAWTNVCGVPGMCDSLGLSLEIGIIASLTAAVLGTMVAFALGRYRFRARAGTNLLIFLPMATPEVVMGSSLLTLFIAMGIPTGRTTILIAHIMFCLSFVIVTVKARVASLDPRLEQAAADLYANEVQAFLKVTFPLVAPGIAAGTLLAFSLSFDDFIITNFNASPSSVTFPMYVWGAAQRGTPVQINVIGTIMFLGALAIVVVGQVLSSRRSRQAV
ncbi:ABC transporter permease [Humibacillus sp. DSM 29435]|uniref:ABC transporter permease n=1 Tax=Humibacillus sp. DSM 29435 TaxID=1869167 RepID=UPI0008725841|nr:ABC transporter permease [Humibacillus sp. DSM 29435]OFE16632.1 ABC transporter permease [Humibacillus sp. DSM 29435]